MEDYFFDFDFEKLEGQYDKINSTHPLLSLTTEVVPLKVFLKDYFRVYADISLFPGFENGILELPVLVFTNYDDCRVEVINLMELNFFEVLKFIDFLVIEKKEAGTYVLRGTMPEDFYDDRAHREKLKAHAEAAERRRIERNTTGWIPNAEIGR